MRSEDTAIKPFQTEQPKITGEKPFSDLKYTAAYARNMTSGRGERKKNRRIRACNLQQHFPRPFAPFHTDCFHKRIWVFYRKFKVEPLGKKIPLLSDIKGTMNYVTKSKGSSTFKNEISTNIFVNIGNVVYTKNNGKLVISIVYSYTDLYIYYTDNNGVSWNGPRKLEACDSYETDQFMLPPFASPFGTQNIYIPCFKKKQGYYAIDISSDLGKTWRRINTEDNKIGFRSFSLFSFSKDAMGNEIL